LWLAANFNTHACYRLTAQSRKTEAGRLIPAAGFCVRGNWNNNLVLISGLR
jgi:hypothetical protein